jgi:chromosome segregation ATPase
VAKSPTEHIRDLTARISVLEERDETRRAALEELKSFIRQEREERKDANEKHRDELTQLRRELSEARQETATLKQQFQDHLAVSGVGQAAVGSDRGSHRRGAVAGVGVDRGAGPQVIGRRSRMMQWAIPRNGT